MQNPLSVCAKCISIELIHSSFVMPALVAGIDVLEIAQNPRRGWHRNSGFPEFGINKCRKSGKPDLR